MTLLNPVDHPEAFDAIVLAGVRSPGVVKLSGHERKVAWDVKSAKGLAGASVSLKEIPPAEFTAEFYLADAEDFDAWPSFLALIDSTVSGASPKALEVYHPDLAELLITSVVKASTVGTKHDGKGGQTKSVRFQEYFPPKPKSGSPSGSKSKPKKKDDPDQAALDELAKLTDQYKNTPWG